MSKVNAANCLPKSKVSLSLHLFNTSILHILYYNEFCYFSPFDVIEKIMGSKLCALQLSHALLHKCVFLP